VVDDKWLGALDAAIHGEIDRVSQQLTQRVKELAQRYETSLPQMVGRVAELETKVTATWRGWGSHGTESQLQAEVGGDSHWAVSTVGTEFSIQLGKMLDAEKNVGVRKPFLGNQLIRR